MSDQLNLCCSSLYQTVIHAAFTKMQILKHELKYTSSGFHRQSMLPICLLGSCTIHESRINGLVQCIKYA